MYDLDKLVIVLNLAPFAGALIVGFLSWWLTRSESGAMVSVAAYSFIAGVGLLGYGMKLNPYYATFIQNFSPDTVAKVWGWSGFAWIIIGAIILALNVWMIASNSDKTSSVLRSRLNRTPQQ